MVITARELREEQKKKIRKSKDTYKQFLEQCYKRLEYANEQGKTNIQYTLPVLKMGMPLYDVNYGLSYVKTKLMKNGFKVVMSGQNSLYIDWSSHS